MTPTDPTPVDDERVKSRLAEAFTRLRPLLPPNDAELDLACVAHGLLVCLAQFLLPPEEAADLTRELVDALDETGAGEEGAYAQAVEAWTSTLITAARHAHALEQGGSVFHGDGMVTSNVGGPLPGFPADFDTWEAQAEQLDPLPDGWECSTAGCPGFLGYGSHVQGCPAPGASPSARVDRAKDGA